MTSLEKSTNISSELSYNTSLKQNLLDCNFEIKAKILSYLDITDWFNLSICSKAYFNIISYDFLIATKYLTHSRDNGCNLNYYNKSDTCHFKSIQKTNPTESYYNSL